MFGTEGRAGHVGSFLRPRVLLDARDQYARKHITAVVDVARDVWGDA